MEKERYIHISAYLYNYIIHFFSILKPLLMLGIFGALAVSGLAFSQSLNQESRIASLESMQNTLKSRQASLCSSVSKSEIKGGFPMEKWIPIKLAYYI